MAEPKVETILNCIAARLVAKCIAGTLLGDWPVKYNMSPGGVIVADAAKKWEQYLLEASMEQVALIRPGDEALVEMTTGSYTSQLEVWILAARAFKLGPNLWRPEEPRRVTVQNYLAKDVEMAILFDINNCDTCDNTEILDVNRQPWRDGWAVVELRLLCTFDAQRPLHG